MRVKELRAFMEMNNMPDAKVVVDGWYDFVQGDLEEWFRKNYSENFDGFTLEHLDEREGGMPLGIRDFLWAFEEEAITLPFSHCNFVPARDEEFCMPYYFIHDKKYVGFGGTLKIF